MDDYEAHNYIKSVGGVGILTTQDVRRLNEVERHIYSLMRKGEWWTRTALESATGAQEATRRMRKLREIPGVFIDCVRAEGRSFKYRMRFEKPTEPNGQLEMF